MTSDEKKEMRLRNNQIESRVSALRPPTGATRQHEIWEEAMRLLSVQFHQINLMETEG